MIKQSFCVHNYACTRYKHSAAANGKEDRIEGFAYTILLFCFILRLRISEIQLPASSIQFIMRPFPRAAHRFVIKKKDNKY
jgi:hypothetical protein